jgi:hypothetical protein
MSKSDFKRAIFGRLAFTAVIGSAFLAAAIPAQAQQAQQPCRRRCPAM